MLPPRLPSIFRAIALIAVCGVIGPVSFAQGPAPDAPLSAVEPTAQVSTVPASADGDHKFWDRRNLVLFGAVTALDGADFAVTRSILQNGGHELNPVVRVFGRSTPGLALNFAGETAGVVAISYFFHKTGHHRMERMVSMVNIAASTGAVTYGLTHR